MKSIKWILIGITVLGLLVIHKNTSIQNDIDTSIYHKAIYFPRTVKTVYVDKNNNASMEDTPLYVMDTHFYRFNNDYYLGYEEYTFSDWKRLTGIYYSEQPNTDFHTGDYARFKYLDLDELKAEMVEKPSYKPAGFLKFRDETTLQSLCFSLKDMSNTLIDAEVQRLKLINPKGKCQPCDQDPQPYCVKNETNDDFLK